MFRIFILVFFFMTKINATELSVITHNLAMKNDQHLFNSMANSLKKNHLLPDFIILQEAVGTTGDLLRSSFQMNGHFVPRPGDNEAVGVLSRYPISFRDGLTLKSRKNGFFRTAAMIEVNHPKLGLIRVISLHLAYRFEEENIRSLQIQEIISWNNSRENNKQADLLILGGDFNGEKREKLFSKLNSFYNSNSNIITHFPTNRRIDYIFFKMKKLSVYRYQEVFPFPDGRIYGSELSDHKTLYFSLNLK